MIDKNALIKRAIVLEWFLIVYNVCEAVAAIFFGFASDSIALVGFGFDSVIEVSAALMLVWRLSHKGSAEEENAKEKKALRFVGLTFFALAAYVFYESVMTLMRMERPDPTLIGIIIASVSLAIMPALGLMKMRIAKEIGSKALRADAMETLLCAYLSATLLLGVGLNWLFGWWWADPVSGLVMVYFLIKEGRESYPGKDICCGKDRY